MQPCLVVFFFSYVGTGDLDTASALALCTTPWSPLENLHGWQQLLFRPEKRKEMWRAHCITSTCGIREWKGNQSAAHSLCGSANGGHRSPQHGLTSMFSFVIWESHLVTCLAEMKVL